MLQIEEHLLQREMHRVRFDGAGIEPGNVEQRIEQQLHRGVEDDVATVGEALLPHLLRTLDLDNHMENACSSSPCYAGEMGVY